MHRKTLGYAMGVACAGTILAFSARTAVSQSTSATFVGLQSSTPGTTQTGNLHISSVAMAGLFKGSGAALTNLPANQITTGLLDPNRLGPTVAKTTQLNTFAAVQRFASNVLMTSQNSTILFPAVGAGAQKPMMTMFASGTSNDPRMIIAHSPNFPDWGIQYDDNPDKINFLSGGTDVMTVDLGSEYVGIGTSSPQNVFNVIGDNNNNLGIMRVTNGTAHTWTPGRNAALFDAQGDGNYAVAVLAAADNPSLAYALYGQASGAGDNYGIYASASGGATNYAGYFSGLLFANSSSAGVKSFLIDHPLDPEHKLLEHSSVESSERMNLYRGHVVTDGTGYATVTVPDWFTALNENIQYSLTVVDDNDSDSFVFAKVSHKLDRGAFKIRTSQPNTEVNWMVTGVRHDRTSQAHPLIVERDKTQAQYGKYLDPKAYGVGDDKAMNPPIQKKDNHDKP